MATATMPATPTRIILPASRAEPAFSGPLVVVGTTPVVEGVDQEVVPPVVRQLVVVELVE